jgi:hypothetical protein
MEGGAGGTGGATGVRGGGTVLAASGSTGRLVGAGVWSNIEKEFRIWNREFRFRETMS